MKRRTMNIEKVIERVNGSMAIEGMPLSSEDKARIRRYNGNKSTLNAIKRELIEKHTVHLEAENDRKI